MIVQSMDFIKNRVKDRVRERLEIEKFNMKKQNKLL